MRTVFQDLLLLTYHVSPELLGALLPDHVRPYVFRGESFISIVVANIRGMRPDPVPEFLGVNYYQVVYRAVVCIEDEDGTVRPGVFFLRSDGNDPVMTFFGNQFTEFRFHYFSTGAIGLFERGSDLLVSVETSDKKGDLAMHLTNLGPAEDHPPHPSFESVKQERDLLVQLFHAYAYDEEKQVVYDMEIERGEWDLYRLELASGFSAFFTEGPFTKEQARPGSMMYIKECHYVWKPMVAVPVKTLKRTPSDGS
jgi:uncharacterized protein YqjF (DUF2071 family)